MAPELSIGLPAIAAPAAVPPASKTAADPAIIRALRGSRMIVSLSRGDVEAEWRRPESSGRQRRDAAGAAASTGPATAPPAVTNRRTPDVQELHYGRDPAALATTPSRPPDSENASAARHLRPRAARHQYTAALTVREIGSNGMRRWHSRYCPCATTRR